jgi:type IV secretory pathway VirB6-like protein
METILGLLLLVLLLVGGCCLFFLVFIQPIWGVVDVAVSKEHSGGTKAAVILLTLLLLGPIMTFFYACFGTRSRVLRRSTLLSFVVVLLSGGAALGLAIAVPMVKQKLPWRTAPAESTENVIAAPAGASAEAEANSVDPETVPSFTAVHLVRDGSSR